MSREMHKASVLLCTDQTDIVAERLDAASEESDTLLDRLTTAVGDDPVSTSARGAYMLTLHLRDELAKLNSTLITIKLHLNDYNDTF